MASTPKKSVMNKEGMVNDTFLKHELFVFPDGEKEGSTSKAASKKYSMVFQASRPRKSRR